MNLETPHLVALFASFSIQTPHHFGRNGPRMVLLVGRRSQRRRRLPFSPVSTQFSALAKAYPKFGGLESGIVPCRCPSWANVRAL